MTDYWPHEPNVEIKMAKSISVVEYDETYFDKWDDFVLNRSANGTFLQTRAFLNYHTENIFTDDASLVFMKGNEIAAVIPAHKKHEGNDVVFMSHGGSTFGGIVIGGDCCNISFVELIVNAFNEYLSNKGYNVVVLKQTGALYSKKNCDLIDYFLYADGYKENKELGSYIAFSEYDEDTISNFSSSRRRDYRYSLKNELSFKELNDRQEIVDFYDVLCDNYKKFNKKPVHTCEELLDFKFDRLKDQVRFFGVYMNEEMIAGCMAFCFFDRVFHTQYLAVRQDKKDCFANEFMYKELIDRARQDGYSFFSLGTSVLTEGIGLNTPLALFKEGFGTRYYINRIYEKRCGI